MRTRTFVLDNLRQSTPCAADGFDQSSFGIPKTSTHPTAVKQAWSGFGAHPDPGHECIGPIAPNTATPNTNPPQPSTALSRPAAGRSDDAASDLDLAGRAMHTTGTVGDHDDKIIVVLTLEAPDTTWKVAAGRITRLTKYVDQHS